ncbi:trypsin-like serine protease [Stigmatella hybrida]|uniref:trypsin-like serine protease n=1 Tax=Stigmatella hybrida TaxID=394097 RepID=UPI00295E4290|nr:trypsin-like serine protease [Stigmatella hybrida]
MSQEQAPQAAPASASQEIVGGANTTIAENPWQVSLQDGSFHFCGGSIINENWILTAQHCVNSGGSISKPGRVVAGITKVSGSSAGQIRTVAEVVVYPGYVDANIGKDAALLRLSSPLDLSGPNAKAIPLATAADGSAGFPSTGSSVRVTGWGTLRSGGSSPDTLQTVDVSVLTNAQAQSSYPQETISADQLAAAAAGKDSCQGDSGGPLTALKGSTRVLAGIVSWGYGCADARYPGMYARVSSFESWINSTINGTTPPPTGSTLLNQSGISGASKAWKHYAITVPSGATKLTVNQSGGTGDADLYVRRTSQPTTSSYNCRSQNANNTESCSVSSPAAGTWYVSVYGYSAFSGVTVTATVP